MIVYHLVVEFEMYCNKFFTTFVLFILVLFLQEPPVAAANTLACLITKNNRDGFFVKMKEGAISAATAAGVDLKVFAGENDYDDASQIAAIENCVASGARGILIAPLSDSVGPALLQARAANILVISLETSLRDANTADAIITTNWAAAASKLKTYLGDQASSNIAVSDSIGEGNVDLAPIESVFGKNNSKNIILNAGDFSGQFIRLLRSSPIHANTVLASIDGSCQSVMAVEQNEVHATVIANPQLMSEIGIEKIRRFASDGDKPPAIIDIDTNLVLSDSDSSSASSIGIGTAKSLCFDRSDLGSNKFVWIGVKESGDGCPVCPTNGACPTSIILAKEQCCPKNGACP